MRPSLRPLDILIDAGRASTLFQRFLNFLNGLIDGELQTEEIAGNVTNTKYGTMYFIDSTAANRTVDLPDLTNNQKTKWIFVKNVGTGTNTVTLNPTGSTTIDGDSSVVLNLNAYVMVSSTRTQWFIIGV